MDHENQPRSHNNWPWKLSYYNYTQMCAEHTNFVLVLPMYMKLFGLTFLPLITISWACIVYQVGLVLYCSSKYCIPVVYQYLHVCITYSKDVLSEDRAIGDASSADKSNFLHPVLYYYGEPINGRLWQQLSMCVLI